MSPTVAKKPAPAPPLAPRADTPVATRVGIVESDRRAKTRKVVVPNLSRHAKYGKILRRRTVLHVHDERNESVLGDLVEVAPCKPKSKTKFWTLVRVVKKGAGLRFESLETPGQERKD